jgi:hypothetical protein
VGEGSPDFTNNVRLLAIDPAGELITIAADAAGRLITALYGSVSIDGPVDVNQTDLNRTMKGADGATLRTIVVDAAGRIVAVMTGNYGGTPTTLAVDASGNIVASIKGTDGTTARTILTDTSGRMLAVLRDPTSANFLAIDASGYLTAVLKGISGSTLKTVATDSSGRIVTVLRDPTNDRYLAVDASGNIVAVIKGEYAGTLKTLATDANGNLVAVLNDQSNVFGSSFTLGLAELAVRLGSFSTFERRGEILWHDSFEDGLIHWATAVTGAGGSVSLDTTDSKTGKQCVKLAGGTSIGSTAGITRTEILPNVTARIGAEFSFRDLVHGEGPLEFFVLVDDGTTLYEFIIKWDADYTSLYLWNADEWQILDDSNNLNSVGRSWSSIKLVIDQTTMKYLRLYANHKEYDVSAYSPSESGDVHSPAVTITIRMTTSTINNETTLVDRVIITTNEPAT